MTVPVGHWHLATHCLVQIGLGSVQFGGQAEPQNVKSWPFTGQPENIIVSMLDRNIVGYLIVSGFPLI